ncbi:hypothetical protein BGW36DRAFT_433440 [Talaromyces proteolyticus]|uniref:Zn(2)-C6 fungal-type domain-containing protein n=1 Tax=Talaromyces proteolyticus TaxID=1131652 RepID=A0AAD4KF38_9EURO|nr:uncharacterized protein BGW36DRAFT_433440 [Talaromyces proteolyticus]KAH8689440.1 hypothetical protein BGW36DRAFT_433440 [Talaromyces proteolyticus]
MRSTQRAPRSCSECTSRKIKCNKVIPCRPCRKRGQAARCTREPVIVRGVITVAEDVEPEAETRNPIRSIPTENIHSTCAEPPQPTSSRVDDTTLASLEGTSIPQFSSPIKAWGDIILPSRHQSMTLVEHGRLWTSWIHCALDHASFEEQHNRFWNWLGQGHTIEENCPAWLAIFFASLAASLLTIDTAEADISEDSVSTLLANWYGASLFCLEQADYLRNFDIRSVQSIAILQMCCSAVGDFRLRSCLLPLGIRIASWLKLPYIPEQGYDLRQCEWSRRLWWTLVICEWLTLDSHRPCISEEDFDMEFPSVSGRPHLSQYHNSLNISEQIPELPSAWVYHRVIAQIATIYYRFQRASRGRTQPLGDLVTTANEQLAAVLDNLPFYLQPDGQHATDAATIAQCPWMEWQRVDLCNALLSYRIFINRSLLQVPSISSERSNGARKICTESAQMIISITSSTNIPVHQRRYGTYTLRLFNAGLTLISDARQQQQSGGVEASKWITHILHCIKLLEQARDRNLIAKRAAEILSNKIAEFNLH